jgi:hypothetical protein
MESTMTAMKATVQILAGAAFGAALVLSCSDNSPRPADAACECQPSEPPVAGRIVVIESVLRTVAPMQLGGVGVECEPGMQFLSGSCTTANPTLLEDVAVQQFGFDKDSFSWLCAFKNNSQNPVQVKALVMCLKPPT